MDALLNVREEVREADDVRNVRRVNNNRIRRYTERISPLQIYDDAQFYRKYRISKQTARVVVNLIRADLDVANTRRGLPISAEIKTLAALRYFAKGVDQDEISEKHGFSQSTLSRIIKEVVTAIARHRAEFITFPVLPQDVSHAKRNFYQIARCPGIVGAIDCTHIKIKNPGVQDQYPMQYHNRKGFYSLNVQVVSDANCKILDIVARWRGTVHDARIWHNSTLKRRFEHGEVSGILLGDSGYPASRHLLTPVLNPRTPQEERYNSAHINLEVAKNAIVALAIIHNISISAGANEEERNGNLEEANAMDGEEQHPNNRVNAFRQLYINRYFN